MAENSVVNSSLRLLGSKIGAKIGTWYVRICNPYIEKWKMKTKKGEVEGSKFIARLVANDETEYCIGVVPFDFNHQNAAAEALVTFMADTVWKLEQVCLIDGNDLKYTGSTVNVMIDLKKTKTKKKLA